MRIIVIGAGIGGSTLALSLERAGLDFVLLEQAEAFGEVGAGIQLSPNGARILDNLGLGDRLAAFCAEPDYLKYIVWDTGEVILRTTLNPTVKEAYGHAYYNAHRADLIDLLTSEMSSENIRQNHKVVEVGQDGDGVWALCQNGERFEGDILIGSDGIHSVVREQVFQPGLPRRSGYVTWRGVVDTADIAHLDIPVSSYVDMGPNLSFVYYYVSGGRKFNWLALGQATDEKLESWSQRADRDEILELFDGWYDRPKKLIEATESPFVTALYDRDPLPGWVRGRIAVTGDAAHAMLPYHAQGAVQSMEDAWVLARCLELGQDDPMAALSRFEELRYDRANRMVRHSREAEGWYHLEDEAALEQRNSRFRRINENYKDRFTPQQHWLYSYDAEQAALGTDDDWRNLPPW